MQISVNVLGRRGPDAAVSCLRHLGDRLPEGVRIRFLDDGSQPEVAQAVGRLSAEIEILSLPYDHGFAGAHNRGLRRAFSLGDDAVLMLSEDARPRTGFLEPLVEVMKWRPRAALVSPKILLAGSAGSAERIWYAGGAIDWWRGLALHRGAGSEDRGGFDRPEPTDFATAVAMLVRRQAFDRTGPMDESYFNHLHDVDWSVRARRVGMEVHYQPRSVVRYEAPGAGTTDTRAAIDRGAPAELARELVRSRLRLVANHGRWYHWPAVGPRVAAEATQGALRSWRRRDVPPPGGPSA